MYENVDIDDTIFGEYDTVIFDLDQTIWDCYREDGTSIGAYQIVPPLKLMTSDIVVDTNGSIIRLQSGLKALLEKLDEEDINLGIVSSGELENRPFEAQPSVMILKKFDIYKYFNHDVILKHHADKKLYVKPLGKTLFIDDRNENIDAVNSDDIDVLWRRAFRSWEDLVTQRLSFLNFSSLKTAFDDTEDYEYIKGVLTRNQTRHYEDVRGVDYAAEYSIKIQVINIPGYARQELDEGYINDAANLEMEWALDDFVKDLMRRDWVESVHVVGRSAGWLVVVPKDEHALREILEGNEDFDPNIKDVALKIDLLSDEVANAKREFVEHLESQEFWMPIIEETRQNVENQNG